MRLRRPRNLDRYARIALAVIAVGTCARFALALLTDGVRFDLRSFELVRLALATDPLSLYSTVGPERWPYMSGGFALVAAGHLLSALVPVAFADALRLLLSLADAALAALVFAWLRTWADGRRAVMGCALVALGPAFVAVTGHHGQLDTVMWLPAVGAIWAWTREDAGSRAVVAGLLLGIAVSLKTVPVLLLLALLPTSTSVRESARLVVATLAVPAVAMLPWLLAEPAAVIENLQYRGNPGWGGLVLIAQPDYAAFWLSPAAGIVPSAQARWLFEHNTAILLAGLLPAAAILVRGRVRAPEAAVVVMLTVLIFGVSFSITYPVWLVTLLIVAGRLGWAAAAQAVLLVPILLAYGAALRPERSWPEWVALTVYAPIMIGFFVVTVIAWLLLLARLRPRRAPA